MTTSVEAKRKCSLPGEGQSQANPRHFSRGGRGGGEEGQSEPNPRQTPGGREEAQSEANSRQTPGGREEAQSEANSRHFSVGGVWE